MFHLFFFKKNYYFLSLYLSIECHTCICLNFYSLQAGLMPLRHLVFAHYLLHDAGLGHKHWLGLKILFTLGQCEVSTLLLLNSRGPQDWNPEPEVLGGGGAPRVLTKFTKNGLKVYFYRSAAAINLRSLSRQMLSFI